MTATGPPGDPGCTGPATGPATDQIANTLASVDQAKGKSRVKPVLSVDRAAFRAYLVALAASGERAVWSEFADRAADCLAPRYWNAGARRAWRGTRQATLEAVDELGLTATVTRTDNETPLSEHFADLAGLVHVGLDAGGVIEPAPPSLAGYAARMAAAHGLTLADRQIPRASLRAFCGQYAEGAQLPAWADHVHTWLDRDGLPVLTVEPYAWLDDPCGLIIAVNRYVAARALPLRVVGPYPGVWSASAILVRLEYDADTPTLAAELVVEPPSRREAGSQAHIDALAWSRT